MKSKLGIICVILGLAMVISSLGLCVYNYYEQQQAGESVDEIMPQMVQAIRENREDKKTTLTVKTPAREETALTEDKEPTSEPLITEMETVEIDGNRYIGFVAMPTVNRELPIMADWSYPKLKKSPCLFREAFILTTLFLWPTITTAISVLFPN